MGEGPVEYWCAVPNAVDLLPASRQRPAETATCNTHQSEPSSLHPASGPKVIYYCVDDWGKFENLDGPWLEKKEARLIERADVIFTPAEHLEKKCAGIEAENRPGQTAGKIHRMPHGVEYRKFAKAISKDLSIPIDVAGLSKPVVGFYGNLYPWIDFDLLDDLVSRCSDYTFIVIGQAYCDISRFSKYGNIHLLGRREHDQLPAYCKAFDAAIVPYDIKNPRMESVNPVKIKELLAAGVPIVASDIPEVRSIEGVIPAKGIDEWMAALELQISRTDRYELSHSVRQEDWSVKVAQMRGIVEKTGKSGVNYEML
jgi:glycosyltransferase involved in cell wall biosynthesis